MLVRRLGNDLPIEWTIERNGEPESFAGLTLKLYTSEIGGRKVERTGFTYVSNVISWTWLAVQQEEPGTYVLTLEEYDSEGNLINTIDSSDRILLTSRTSEQDESENPSSESATFTSNINGVAYTYDALRSLIEQAQSLIAQLQGIGLIIDGKSDAIDGKISEINDMIRQSREYQALWGSQNPYTDAKFDEAMARSAAAFSNAIMSMHMIEAALRNEFGSSINPITIQTMQAIFGSTRLQFDFIANLYTLVHSNYSAVIYRLYSDKTEYRYGDRVIYSGNGYECISIQPITGVSPESTLNWRAHGSTGLEYDTTCVFLDEACIAHMTLGIGAVTPSHTYHDHMRWSISSAGFVPLEQDNVGYYIYIKASKSLAQDIESEDDCEGGTGTAEFVVTPEPIDFEDTGYYYFLYATINPYSAGYREITTWNGFTSITPGEIKANIFRSTDGYQLLDFLNKVFLVGDADHYLAWNLDGDEKLRIKGGLVISPDGDDEYPIVINRGAWVSGVSKAYFGEVWTYEGQAWLCKWPHALTPNTAVTVDPYEGVYWTLYVKKGNDGQPGAAGASAVRRWLELTTTAVNVDKDGTVTPSTVTARALMQVGSEEVEDYDDESSVIKYGYDTQNPTTTYNGHPLTIDGTKSVLVFKLYESNGTSLVELDSKSVSITKDGQDGRTGASGDNGENGYNTVTIMLYQRAASAPQRPQSDGAYDFERDELTFQGEESWSRSIPADNGYPLWMTFVRLSTREDTESILSSQWSSVVKFIESAVPGAAGKIMRGPTVWTSGFPYQGLDGDGDFVDFVFLGDDTSKMYLCKKDTSTVSPPSSTYWEEQVVQEFVATKVLYSALAYVENLGVNVLKISKAGTVYGAFMPPNTTNESNGNWMLWAGAAAPANAPFRVNQYGEVYNAKNIASGYQRTKYVKLSSLSIYYNASDYSYHLDGNNSFIVCDDAARQYQGGGGYEFNCPRIVLPTPSESLNGLEYNIYVDMQANQYICDPFILISCGDGLYDFSSSSRLDNNISVANHIKVQHGFIKIACVPSGGRYIWCITFCTVAIRHLLTLNTSGYTEKENSAFNKVESDNISQLKLNGAELIIY